MSDPGKNLPSKSSTQEIDAFLRKLASAPAPRGAGRGRLLFALDATASREPTWDQAMDIQADMFRETAALGGLAIQLAFYRGLGEFRVSPWLSDSAELLRRMATVRCLGGQTQIEKLLRHAVAEAGKARLHAVVFVGDCMEENVDALCAQAGRLGVLGVPVFLFHEGDDLTAADAFRHIARLSGGACCRFDAASPRQLRELLSAVAVYAAGGRKALTDYGARRGGMALLIANRMKGA